jgi:hypothetical protein
MNALAVDRAGGERPHGGERFSLRRVIYSRHEGPVNRD